MASTADCCRSSPTFALAASIIPQPPPPRPPPPQRRTFAHPRLTQGARKAHVGNRDEPGAAHARILDLLARDHLAYRGAHFAGDPLRPLRHLDRPSLAAHGESRTEPRWAQPARLQAARRGN